MSISGGFVFSFIVTWQDSLRDYITIRCEEALSQKTKMGNTDRRGPEISDGWQGTSDDGSGVDMTSGGALKVAVVGAGVAGLGTSVPNF